MEIPSQSQGQGEQWVDCREGCRVLGIKMRTWNTWKSEGRLPQGVSSPIPGKPGRKHLYPMNELLRIRDERANRTQLYPDPERPGCWRVPITSKLHQMEAIIDEAELPIVQGKQWWWSPGRNGSGSVVLAVDGSPKPPLHRMILGVSDPEQLVAHLNGDPLDCRRKNLVARTRSESKLARAKVMVRGGRECTSRYKGVSWRTAEKKWGVAIKVNKQLVQLGMFRDEVIAARRYDEAARELCGAHAALNFPNGVDPDVAAASAAKAAALEPPPVPPGMIDRYEACEMFGISIGTWMVWERRGYINCHQWFTFADGCRRKFYPLVELEKLRGEFARLGKPYPDPERPGCYRVPLKSYLAYREALIDAEDLPLVEGRNWNWSPRSEGVLGGCVVLATVTGPQTPLQRIIMGATGHDARVQFANGDPLDCRRCNLVVRTHAQQCRHNRKMGSVNGREYTSKFKGVSRDKTRGKWVAQIHKDGIGRNLGRFDDEIDAAQAYDNAARELFGEHARLNFPDDEPAAPVRAA